MRSRSAGPWVLSGIFPVRARLYSPSFRSTFSLPFMADADSAPDLPRRAFLRHTTAGAAALGVGTASEVSTSRCRPGGPQALVAFSPC